MIKKYIPLIFFLQLLSCGESKRLQTDNASTKGLKDYYKDYFPIGVAVSIQALKTDEAALITEQFNRDQFTLKKTGTIGKLLIQLLHLHKRIN